MPLEKIADLEIGIIKNIQSKIHSMEKYFRQLTGDQSITITLNINQNAIVISSKELSEETAAILKIEIQPFHTKFNKKINQTVTVARSEFAENKITITFDKKTRLLDFCTDFYTKFKSTRDHSTTFRDLGFIYYDNNLKVVNIMENILIEIKNDRIKKYLEHTNSHPIKKTSAEIAKLTQQAAVIKENAKKLFFANQCETESYKDLGKQMQQISALLYQNARAESYDHYEQLTKDKIFYFHLQLLRADEVYAKAHALHEEIHSLSSPALVTFESLDEILNKLNSTAQVEFIENLSIRYCEMLENLIGEICPSITDVNIRKTYHNAAEAINIVKTDTAFSSVERLNQLQMLLESLTSTPENTITKKPKSTTTITPQKFVSETKGSFSGHSIFSVKKNKSTPPALPAETKTESSGTEIFLLEVFKKTQHSIEKLMEENKKSFDSTKLSQ